MMGGTWEGNGTRSRMEDSKKDLLGGTGQVLAGHQSYRCAKAELGLARKLIGVSGWLKEGEEEVEWKPHESW